MPPKVSSKSTGAGVAAGGNGSEDLQKYQKMTDREHILKKPDTYIGTIEPTETMEYVMDVVAASSPPAMKTDEDPAATAATATAAAPAPAPALTSPTFPVYTSSSMKAW